MNNDAMPTTSETPEINATQINLKHRLTGAAVLIFFGALVLPWLLGPPSQASKNKPASSVQETVVHSTFEDQVLAQLQDTSSTYQEPEETVYVSKITPVDGKQVISEPKKVTVESTRPDDAISETSDSSVALPQISKNTSSEKVTKQSTNKPESTKTKVVDAFENESSNPISSSSTNAVSKETVVKAKPKVTPTPQKIDVGWIVQVELLTDKKGAQRLVKQLADKGFEAQTTIVDTNKGKATGTRIWLGPFEQRSQAGDENAKLKNAMGKGGFIRVYP